MRDTIAGIATALGEGGVDEAVGEVFMEAGIPHRAMRRTL